MNQDPCSVASLVEALRDGRVSEREAASVRRHMATCASCAALAAELDRIGALLQVPDPSPLERQRRRMRLLRAAARPRPAPRPAPIRSVLAVAAALAFVLGGFLLLQRRPERPALLTHLPPIPPLAHVRTETTVLPEGGATFTRASDGSLDVVTLQGGAITLSVRPLAAGERFLVRTADAEVEVRGTIFRVEADAGRIRSVQVTEGKVEVRFRGGTWLVSAGGGWAPPVAADAPAARSSASAAPRGGPRAVPPPAAIPRAASTAGAAADQTLAEGVRMADRGDYDAASQRLRAFVDAHPGDDRAEDAAFLIIVSMQRAGRRDEAREAARQYLARYPNGYRRAEAEAIVRAP